MNVFWWVLICYCIGAVAFYRMIVATAVEEPGDTGIFGSETAENLRDTEGIHGRAA